MNLGGTEKSFLNLVDQLPKDCEIDLLFLEEQGVLMNEIPANVNVLLIENHQIINEFIKSGSRRFAFQQFAKGNISLFFKCVLQFVADKFKLGKNPYWAISTYIKPIEKKYDISVAYAGIHNFIAFYIIKKTESSKKVLWIHFDVDKVISDFSFGKRYYHLFDQIFCVAENASKIFKKRFSSAKGEVFTFNNIINNEILLKQAEAGESFTDNFNGLRILTLGRLSEEKGQMMIPEVVQRLKKNSVNFRWYLIGEGKLLESLFKEVRNLEIEESLILLGSKMNPYPFLKDCDLYVQTSLHEGYCITLKEAKVFNKPIVTTNFLSASNLINNNEDGLIVDVSEEGIYQGVKNLLENEELRNKFSTTYSTENNYETDIERLLSVD